MLIMHDVSALLLLLALSPLTIYLLINKWKFKFDYINNGII